MASNLDPTLGGQLLSAVDVDKTRVLTALTTIRDELTAAQDAIEAIQTTLALIGTGGGGGEGEVGSGNNMTLSGLTTIIGGVRAWYGANVSGLLNMAMHSGGMFAIDGNVTVPADGGFHVWLYNGSTTESYTVQMSGGSAVHTMAPGEFAFVIAIGFFNVILFPVGVTDRVRL